MLFWLFGKHSNNNYTDGWEEEVWERQRTEELRRLLFICCVLNLTTIKVSNFNFSFTKAFLSSAVPEPKKKLECSLLGTTFVDVCVLRTHISWNKTTWTNISNSLHTMVVVVFLNQKAIIYYAAAVARLFYFLLSFIPQVIIKTWYLTVLVWLIFKLNNFFFSIIYLVFVCYLSCYFFLLLRYSGEIL